MKLKLMLVFVVICFMAAFQPVIAEEEPKKDEVIKIEEMEEIIVTGTKIKKKIENLTDSVTNNHCC